jgi:peptidoglycan pentaglycine glycine transferase (the first glycine)
MPTAATPAACEAWQHFVTTHPRGNLLQTTQWGQLKAGFGWDWELVTVGEAEAPTCGAVLLYRRLPLGIGTIAYIPRGPVVDWSNPRLVTQLFEAMQRALRRRRAWACWMEPGVQEGEFVAPLLSDLGYRPSPRTIQPRRTLIVDITSSEDEILMGMKAKTRYNIRLAERKGITVRPGTAEDVGIFHALMEETGDRDQFGVHTEAYYRRSFELFAPHDQVVLLIAEYQGEPLAGLMAFAVGRTAAYISGASSNRHRNLMAPYAVQWAAIRWAKSHGCTHYDLWGIPDADEAQLEEEFAERSDGLWGVYRFKRGFGGDMVRYTGLWERSLHPLYPLALRLYHGFS